MIWQRDSSIKHLTHGVGRNHPVYVSLKEMEKILKKLTLSKAITNTLWKSPKQQKF
jgi:hypothetical protein